MNIYQLTKRLFDIIFSFFLLLLLLPVFLFVVIVQLIVEGRPIFYVSHRYVSIDNEISIPKFRTMVPDAKSEKYRLNERFMRDGYLDIPLTCEVYTPIGRLLERTQLVETLQFLLVLAGHMSFIGNRPLPLDNIKVLQQFDGWEGRFKSPAGISGITQVVGKYELLPRDRLELEKLYSDVYQWGNVVKCDMVIAIYTIRLLLLGKTMPVDTARELLTSCLAK